MDVSSDLADYAAKHTTTVLDRPEPAQVDLGLLAAFDTTPTDSQLYSESLNSHLLQLTLASTTTLLSSLFALPTHTTPLGPVFKPPPPSTKLPREKPVPKPKPPTKWERFAKERGISHKRKERDEWDEERQEWVSRWGRGGKNKEKEEQWIHEVKAKDDADHDPAATARAERKARIAKNNAQHESNLAHAKAGPSTREKRKEELDRSMLISKSSTASLGKFDKKIEGEPKVKGVKRKFEANVSGEGWGDEKGKALDVLRKVESGDSKKKKGTQQEEGGVNHRKAVRHLGREERMNGRGGGGGRGGSRGGRGGGRGGRGGKR